MSHRWTIKIILQCILFVIVVRPEEVFNTMPPPFESKFSCYGKNMGFYADVEADCKVYHTCDDYGNKFTYRCPQETAFRQDALICDHAHLVDCRKTVIPEEETQENPQHVPALSLEPPRDSHRSYSRSFHIVRQPTKPQSTSTNAQPGFVLSASLFLRDRPTTKEPSPLRKDFSTSSTLVKHSTNSPNCQASAEEKKLAYNTDSTSISNPYYQPRGLSLDDTTSQDTFSNSRTRDYYPYSETLRSIQANNRETTSLTTQRPLSTTELPVHALTLSLKPLVPNELEYDPYYPKMPTSTEAYYTPNHQHQNRGQPSFRSTTPPSWENVRFEIPAVLPDLNSLEDLVDRRKLFYIPRLKAT